MEVNQPLPRGDFLEQEKKLFNKALNCLARREHSTKELQEKLNEYSAKYLGISDLDTDIKCLIDNTLERVKKIGYLDDERFAQMYIRSRTARGFGPRRIQAELARKGVKVDDTCAYEYSEQVARVVDGIGRKIKWSNISEPKVRAQISRHYAAKGFSFDTIRAAIEIVTRSI